MAKETQPDPKNWSAFEQPQEPLRLDSEEVVHNWAELHRGDCEPLPTADRVRSFDPSTSDPEAVARDLIEAWRLFHIGEFAQAVMLADAIGPIAHAVANKASGIYADYLEEDDDAQKAIYAKGMDRAAQAIALFPEDPNAHYFHAFMTGRYSQCISVAKALKDGLAGQVKTDLARVIDLQPKHAEAYIALGLFHAEVINKVGRMVGSVTYGASASEAKNAFKTALKLNPDSPIAWIEYGNALYLISGEDALEQSNEAYETAAQCRVIDAMTSLDVAYASNSLDAD